MSKEETITIDGNLLFRYLTGNHYNMVASANKINDFLLQITKLGYKYFGEEIKVEVIQKLPGTTKVSIKYPDLLAKEVNLL